MLLLGINGTLMLRTARLQLQHAGSVKRLDITLNCAEYLRGL